MTKQYTATELADWLDKTMLKNEKFQAGIRMGMELQRELDMMIYGSSANKEFEVFDHIDQASAMLRAMEWQPIETAPKDGTTILVMKITADTQNEFGYNMYPNEVYTAYWDSNWIKEGTFMSNDCYDDVSNIKPTHWRPKLGLPPAPKESE